MCTEFSTATRNPTSGGVVHDKCHACYYCDIVVTNVGRHYQETHHTEDKVLCLRQVSNNKEKHAKLAKLRLLGDYHHNLKVLQLHKAC